MPPKATLKEVAALAGVSYQTVSKVLNKQASVTKETEERILQAVRDLDYKPNQLARSLREQRTRLIGYSWEPAPDPLPNSILDRFLQSMAQEAERRAHHVLTFPHRAGEAATAGYRELIDTQRVDAFVLSGVEYDDPRILFLQERNFPFVAFGRSNPDWQFPCVDVDGAAGMQEIVRHLVSQGRRRIAALAWPKTSRVGHNRMDGLQAGLHEAGLSLASGMLVRTEGTYQRGLQSTERLLSLPLDNRPNAIVCFNDPMAIGAMHAIQGHGLVVGRDIAVTGFDDMPMAEFLTPGLTSVRQPIWDVGQRVMELLLDILDNTPPERDRILLKPQMVVRGSSTT